MNQLQQNINDCITKRKALVKEFREYLNAMDDATDDSFKYYENTRELIRILEEIEEVNELHKDNLMALSVYK